MSYRLFGYLRAIYTNKLTTLHKAGSPTRETEAGKKLSSLIPDQKHTFTRPLSQSGQRAVHLAYLPCRKQASLLWLVYLTWTTRRFQSRYAQKTEETVK